MTHGHLSVPLNVQAEPAVVRVVVAGEAGQQGEHTARDRADAAEGQRGGTDGHLRDHRIGVGAGVAALVAPPVPPTVGGRRRGGTAGRLGLIADVLVHKRDPLQQAVDSDRVRRLGGVALVVRHHFGVGLLDDPEEVVAIEGVRLVHVGHDERAHCLHPELEALTRLDLLLERGIE